MYAGKKNIGDRYLHTFYKQSTLINNASSRWRISLVDVERFRTRSRRGAGTATYFAKKKKKKKTVFQKYKKKRKADYVTTKAVSRSSNFRLKYS